MNKEKSSTVIVGGGLSGIITAHILTSLGYPVTLLEKSPVIGGLSTSFKDELGNVFDLGYHALDYGRSELTTNFFARALGGNYHVHELRRGVAVDDKVIPYNSSAEKWPERLRERLPKGEIVDDSSPAPTRQELARIYGKGFSDFVFEEVVASYPVLSWRRQNGFSDENLTNLLYPWYFPKSKKVSSRVGESDCYHDRVRSETQKILYPAQGGFGAILDRILAGLDEKYLTLRKNISQMDFEVDPATRSIKSLTADGEVYRPERVYWCAPITMLCKQFGVQLPPLKPQKIALGSFAFEDEIGAPYQEILVGDPRHLIDRISFRGQLAKTRDNLVQVEFFFPDGQFEHSKDEWLGKWLESLRSLGLLKDSNKLLNFNYKFYMKGFLAPVTYDDLIAICKKGLTAPTSNVIYPFWGLGPENINRVVPSVWQTVIESVCEQ